VVAEVRERLVVIKQRSHILNMQRFNLKNLNEVENKEQYRVEVFGRFARRGGSTSAWETIIVNIKISAKESLGYFEVKKH
jgi:hypothetical protein